MRVIITGRKYNVSTRMKSVIEQKLEKIKFFYDHILSFHVTLEKEKLGFRAEVHFSADGKKFFLQESAGSVNEAVDTLIDKLERQIRKHRDKMQKRKRPDREAANAAGESIPENLKFRSVDENPRDLLEAIRELALSEEEYVYLHVKDEDGVVVAVHKEESDLFTVIGKDAESQRWMQKRIFLAGDDIDQTEVQDYIPMECSLHDAVYQMDRDGSTLMVFWNRDDSAMQALSHSAEGRYELINLAVR